MKHDISLFNFEETMVRTATINGGICWLTADLAKALGFTNIRRTINDFPEDEKGVILTDTLGGPQEMTYLTEPGLYRLIFKSTLPAAERFQRFVFHEVLPSVRKHGFYGRREQAVTIFLRELLDMGLSSRDAAKLAMASFPPITRHEQRMQELREANELALSQDVKLAEENEIFLLEMRPGVSYSIKDFHAMLPDKHPFRKLSAPAWSSSIGKLIQQLVGTGKIVKNQGSRIVTYSLAESQDKIVPMER